MTKPTLPEWDFCREHVEAGTACALETFIHDNEPADLGLEGAHTAQEFRDGLAAVLAEAKADFDSAPCDCWRCRDAASQNKAILYLTYPENDEGVE